jgi:hypothetical protein
MKTQEEYKEWELRVEEWLNNLQKRNASLRKALAENEEKIEIDRRKLNRIREKIPPVNIG